MLASKSIFEAIFTIYCQLGNLQFNLQLSSEITQVTITMLVPDLHVYLYTQITPVSVDLRVNFPTSLTFVVVSS